MRRLIYQVCVGEVPAFYEQCTDSVTRYCERHGIDHLVQLEPVLRIKPLNSCRSENALRLGYLPIFEKEQAFAYLDEYDQIAIIDADIYIKDSAPNIFDELGDATFAAVLERDMPLTAAYFNKIRKYSDGQYGQLKYLDWDWNKNGAAFYNMGMMMFSKRLLDYLDGDTPTEFIRRLEFEKFVNGEGHYKWSTDQTLLNFWVKQSGMETVDLSWKWNALYGAVTDIHRAHFIHFFLSAKMTNRDAEIPAIIKGALCNERNNSRNHRR